LIYAIKKEKQYGQKRGQDDFTIPFDDMGWYLAKEIVNYLETIKLPVVEPDNKIRATVIGAGSLSISVSGSTCYHDPKIHLPLNNVPVVPIIMNFYEIIIGGEKKARQFKETVALALHNYNLVEGLDTFALYFNDIQIRANLSLFSKLLATALPNAFANHKHVIIILGFDGAKMLGLTLKNETALKENLFCLDELFLEAGDWIDIGKPFGENESFPITIKSLIFNQNKHKNDTREVLFASRS
jgi:ethanolamine utilization protein EutA